MLDDSIQEARRQAEICNACRYCEGYCSVFPALHARRAFSDGDITHLANLCHNCRGCYYACQYTVPHEFDLNLPGILATVRRESWEEYAWPKPAARAFQKNGVLLALATVIGFAAIFAAIQMLPSGEGEGFYSVLTHSGMVAISLPAFLFPLVSIAISLRRFWTATGGGRFRFKGFYEAARPAANMKNLSGGHGDGCNFEDEDRFSQSRPIAHQVVMYGFLLCFLSTASGTVLHYIFDLHALHGPISLPKILGVPGGVLMVVGTVWMASLKLQADRSLGDQPAWGGEMAFILLLFGVAVSGLALYWLGASAIMPSLLAIHLGSVLAFFLLTPFTKMAHGFYRLAAMAR